MAKAKQIEWKNRIVAEGEKPAIEFIPNEYNFRLHPETQRQALRGSLSDLGWIQRVIVNRTTGNLIDGHARIAEAMLLGNNTLVPYTEVELTEDEERLALTVLDPIAAEAETSRVKLEALLSQVTTGNAAVMELLARQAERAGIIARENNNHSHYEPRLSPEQSRNMIDSDDMSTAQNKLSDQFNREQVTRPVMCPHCGGEFHVNPESIK